ncbi:subtilisin-like protein [Lactarius akahatsu]|uniref:tripeptidyl-peptidase II n=1 Tax=Lactarius akahatsu TaxID=416441 RepID=A0AAD4Q7T7_9AGAM|nr:subtilisin-like protein [Lactarius akahatsu]
MRVSVLSIVAIGPLRGLAAFAPRWDDVKAKHTWNSVPENWENLGHPPAGTTIEIHIGLRAKNENALIDALYQVRSPGRPKYGAHLSREEVAELVAPPSDVLELVNAWLEYYGIPPSAISTKHGGSWLTVIGIPVPQANELLSASYQLYQHIGTNDTVLCTLSYGLPTTLLEHVQNVAPATNFGFPCTPWQGPLMRHDGAAGAQKKVPTGGPGTTSRYVSLAADRNVLGVVGLLGDYPSPDDLREFMNEYRFDATSATYSVVQIKDGGTLPPSRFRLHIYSTALAAQIPWTVSTPYGMTEYTVPPDYASYMCSLYARLGVRGASVLVSSGNDGVGHGNCLVPDGSGNSRVQFLPSFPSTCPWVTSVGGTTGYNPEVAASLSGGGFSVYFPRPPCQNSAVPTFLQSLGSRYNGLYNPGGRGVPDIAVQAIDFGIIVNAESSMMDGTSCATPAAAGIISLLNDYRISIGRPPLGFLNLWLYGVCLPGLNDITSGSNPGCNTDGFSAVPGWDPVTGLGSLDFERLVGILSRW